MASVPVLVIIVCIGVFDRISLVNLFNFSYFTHACLLYISRLWLFDTSMYLINSALLDANICVPAFAFSYIIYCPKFKSN